MRGGLAASKSREKKKRNACTSHFKGSAPPLLFESFASFRNFGQRATSPSPKGANEVRPPWSVRGPKCKFRTPDMGGRKPVRFLGFRARLRPRNASPIPCRGTWCESRSEERRV